MTVLPRNGVVPSRSSTYGNVSVRIGPVTVGFRAVEGGTSLALAESHEPFIVHDAGSDCLLRCRVAPIVPNERTPIARCSRWDLWKAADGSEEIIFKGPGGVPDWWLRTDGGFRSGELIQRPSIPPLPIRADGYPVLEYLVVRLLGRSGHLLLHASTAIHDGRAYVFVGHSGAGKSTMASIAEAAGARIPTDDRTLFTVDAEGVWAWGTPWHGSLVRKSPERAPVAGIYLLEQAGGNAAVVLPSGRGAFEMFVRLVQPRVNANEVRRVLATLQTIVERVPVFVLRFTPTSAAFETAIAAAERVPAGNS